MRAAALYIRHRIALWLWHPFFFKPFHSQARNVTTVHIVPAAMRHAVVVFAAAAQCHEIDPFEEGVLQCHVQNIPLRDRLSYPARHLPGKGGCSGAKAAISSCKTKTGSCWCDNILYNIYIYIYTPDIYIYYMLFIYFLISFFLSFFLFSFILSLSFIYLFILLFIYLFIYLCIYFIIYIYIYIFSLYTC